MQTEVSENSVAKLVPEMPAEVKLQAYQDQVYKGRLRQIFPSADRAKAIVEVRVSILDPDATREAGDERRASRSRKRASAPGRRRMPIRRDQVGTAASPAPIVLVPKRAVTEQRRTVLRLGRDRGSATRRTVTLGARASRPGRGAQRRGAGRGGDPEPAGAGSTDRMLRPRERNLGGYGADRAPGRHQDLPTRRDRNSGARTASRSSVDDGDFLGLMGPSGLGQVDAAEPARRHRPADARPIRIGDTEISGLSERALAGVARAAHRLHLSALQPDSRADRVRERRAAAAADEAVEEAAPRPRDDRARHRRPRRPREALPAAAVGRAGAARRHRARRSSPTRRCCSPTSRPATSTRNRRPRS